jgi:hypothetical protein
MGRAGFGKDLLELAPRRCGSNPHRNGGSLKAVTLRDSDRHLRFAIGQVECLPERFDSWIVNLIRIADKDDAARGLIGTI